jgi:outer membrane biogenesis lipoprotein LolB
MKRPLAALVIAPLAAALLASCSVAGPRPLGNPDVASMEPVAARDMAQEFCQEVKADGQKAAVQQFATRLAGTEVTTSDQDAIIDFAYEKLCPEAF